MTSSTCGTSQAEVRSAACAGHHQQAIAAHRRDERAPLHQKPRIVSNFMQQRVGRSKIQFEPRTSPGVLRAQFGSARPLREPWTDDGTKLEKRCTLPNRDICRVHDACRFATRPAPGRETRTNIIPCAACIQHVQTRERRHGAFGAVRERIPKSRMRERRVSWGGG